MRTYEIRTYGCQMNVHDSERLAGLLEEAGYVRGPQRRATPDLVVFNTCAVRENADNRLYGNLGHLLPAKNARPGMQIAVGGCLAQKDRGTHRRAGAVGRRRVRHPQPGSPAGAAGTGPAQRRRPRSRSSRRCRTSRPTCPPGASRRTRPGCPSRSAATTPARSASCRACAGARPTAGPATCSPRSRRWSPTASSRSRCSGRTSTPTARSFGDRSAFGKLLRACGEIDGLERVRFT